MELKILFSPGKINTLHLKLDITNPINGYSLQTPLLLTLRRWVVNPTIKQNTVLDERSCPQTAIRRSLSANDGGGAAWDSLQ